MKRMLSLILLACSLAALANPDKENIPARLDVTVQPSEGAKVFVDGVARGPSPCSVFDLAPGMHLVHVEAPSCVPADAFVKIDNGAFVQKNFELTFEKAIVVLKTDPAGADVKSSGVSLGTTPLLLTTLVAGRAYSLELVKTGYQTKKIDLRTEGRHPLVREERLLLDSGLVECTSEPAGATVVVNGVSRGVTPITIDGIPKGLASFKFQLDGYGEEVRELRLAPGDRQTLAIQLKGRPGRLTVVSTPERATVFVDNDYQGRTPITLGKIAPGTHDIRVELEGHAPLSRTIQIANGAETTEEFALSSVLGRIELVTTPPGCKISVDGRTVGTTVPQGGDKPTSKILTCEKITAGEHAVLVQCNGYADRSYKVMVKPRETFQLSAKLKRVFTPDIEVETSRGIVKGVLMDKDPRGNLTVETTPGVTQFIPAEEIRRMSSIQK